MSRRRPPRLAVALLAGAVRRWPAVRRAERHREWLGELHAIADDPHATGWARTWRALRFSASLAVRRPAPAPAGPAAAAAGAGPAWGLFGTALGLVPLGTAAAFALAAVPRAVAAVGGYRAAGPGWPLAPYELALFSVGPILVGLGVLTGRRLARRHAGRDRAPLTGTRDAVRVVLAVAAGVLCAQALSAFGEAPAALAATGLWAVGLAAAAPAVARLGRRRRGPLPWLAVSAGGLLLVVLAVTVAVGLALSAADAPRGYAWAWFPITMHDTLLPLPLAADRSTDEMARFLVVDRAELLPHALLVSTAFTLSYLSAAGRANPRT